VSRDEYFLKVYYEKELAPLKLLTNFENPSSNPLRFKDPKAAITTLNPLQPVSGRNQRTID
jgi:hypothetical protein